jgi:D-cysteine desulfhydrase
VTLANLPSPVERLKRLEAQLGIGELYVKRDDISALPYGGGKPRKLEFLFGEAKALGRSRVVSWGSVGSNQAVAVAAHAPRVGLEATLLLLPQQPSPQIRANLVSDLAFGAELLFVSSQGEAAQRAERLARLEGAQRAYSIAMGGSSPLGNMGFVNAAFELDEQIDAGELSEPDVIYLAMGTMGSAVGLAIGLGVCERQTTVVAVRASNPSTSSQSAFRALFDRTVEFIRARDPSFPVLSFEQVRVRFEGNQLGKGYGRATAASQQAVARTKSMPQLQLETTYTGKAFAALVADAPTLADARVLFWNSHNSHPLPTVERPEERVPNALKGYLRAH